MNIAPDFLLDLGWWGVALMVVIALAALAVLLVALIGGLRQARAAALAEAADAEDETLESPQVHSENGDGTAASPAATGGSAAPAGSTVGTDPVQELKLRYARGDIDRDEYLQRRADLEGQ